MYFDDARREVNVKIVYWGAGLSGRCTNLRYIHGKTRPQSRSKIVTLATMWERAMFFNFTPQTLPTVAGFRVRVHLFAPTGSSTFERTQKLILRGVDGVVFVVDSQSHRYDANLTSRSSLETQLARMGLKLETVAFAVQYNKQDIRDVFRPKQLEPSLNPRARPSFSAVATRGVGVFETLRAVVKPISERLVDKYGT